MAQLVVRNLENTVKSRLQHRARRNGHSMEAEARDILRNAVSREEPSARGLGSEIAALFSGVGVDADIPELRGQRPRPARFNK